MSSSKIRKYKKEIDNLKIEIDEERKRRVSYSLKGDSASIVQSFEKVSRLKNQIQEIEYKIYELEERKIKNNEIRDKNREKQAKISSENVRIESNKSDKNEFKKNDIQNIS